MAMRHLQVCAFLGTPHRSASLSLREPPPPKIHSSTSAPDLKKNLADVSSVGRMGGRGAPRSKGGMSLILAAHGASKRREVGVLLTPTHLPPLPSPFGRSATHDAERRHARDRLRVRNASLSLALPDDRFLY